LIYFEVYYSKDTLVFLMHCIVVGMPMLATLYGFFSRAACPNFGTNPQKHYLRRLNNNPIVCRVFTF
jgi:hypothetical protein